MTTRSVMVRIRGDVSDLNRALLGAGRNVKDFSNSLETSNDRATWLAQGLTAIVPAAIPIGAQAVPAIAGLASQLGAAVLAAGTTVLAFQGVGDAMKASIQYEAEPTAANLQKLQEAMQNISPAAQDLVTQVNDLMPQLKGLRDIAAENMFPGMSDGLDSLITLLPRARDLIGSVAEANGRMASEGAASLAGPEWRSFFDYLQRNAAPTTAELGRTIGNLTHGLADLLVAFEPVEQSWSQGMLNMSRSFADWAANLSDTQGFEDFVNYLQTSGPQVLATVGSLADMLVQVAEAAAPLGGPTLAAIRGFATAIGAIADSPIGPVILGIVAATSALSRALAVSDLLFRKNEAGATGFTGKAVAGYRAQMTAIGQLPRAFREATTAQGRLVTAQNEARSATSQYVGQLREVNRMTARGEQPRITTLGKLTDALGKTEMAQFGLRDAEAKAARAGAARNATLRQGAAGFGKTAGAAAALTVATSGMADSFGLTNTATLGLMGTMGGVPGIIGGLVVGAVMDAKAASQGYTEALNDMNKASKDSNFADLAASTGALREQWDALGKDASSSNLVTELGAGFRALGQFATGNNPFNDLGPLQKAEAQVQRLSDTYIVLARSLGQKIPLNAGIDEVARVAASAAPAMRELGISADDLSKMNDADFASAAKQIRAIMVAADSTAGRTQALGTAIRGLDSGMLSTRDSAAALAQALDTLISPGLNAEEATDKYRIALRGLRKELDNKAGFTGDTKGAQANRQVTRDYMRSLTEMLSKQAEAGASSSKIAKGVRDARNAFIAEGVAAGHSAGEMRRRANAIGLTPRLVRTVMQIVNAKAVENITRRLREIPKSKLTRITAAGIPKTEAGMRALQRRYNLTPRQIRTLALLRDSTPAVRNRILAGLRKVDGTTAKPGVNLRDNASGKIASIRSQLAALNGKTAFTTAITIYKSVKKSAGGNLFGPETTHFAAGGWGNSPDVANGHLPHLARGGTMRVFAEPETKGEAYIPLANDWRRPRARDIAAATVGMLGGQVEWFAQGGFAPAYASASSGPSAGGSGSQNISLAGALAGAQITAVFPGVGQVVGRIVDDKIADARDTAASMDRARR